MIKIILVSLFVSMSAFAQSQIDTVIRTKVDRINTMLDRNLPGLSAREKAEINLTLSNTIQELNQIMRDTPTPVPTPIPSNRDLRCSWVDGNSFGIAQRGYHLIEVIRGIHISKGFYGNNSTPSSENCLKDLIVQAVPQREIEQAKRRTCACGWFPADNANQPSARGHHMYYSIEVPNGGNNIKEVQVSVGFFQNNSTASQQSCQQALVNTNFSCNL